MTKYTLIIDSTLGGISLAIANRSKGHFELVWQKYSQEKKSSFSFITEEFRKAFVKHSIANETVTEVLVSTGPGSFTGIRIGISWAAGFIAGGISERKICGISSLEALLHSYGTIKEKSNICLLLPSTHITGYCCYQLDEMDKALVTFIHLDDLSVIPKNAEIYVLGDWPQVDEAFDMREGRTTVISREQFLNDSIEAMIKYADKHKVEFSSQIPQARYLKRSSAEERLKP